MRQLSNGHRAHVSECTQGSITIGQNQLRKQQSPFRAFGAKEPGAQRALR